MLITYHFNGMNHEDVRIYKASPIAWLGHFLYQYSPTCNKKYIHLYKGVEIFDNPYIKNLLQLLCYTLHSTGSDTYHQNGPVERYHSTLSNSIQAMLTGANLDIKFWPYALYHVIRLSNSFPEPNKITSPIDKAKSNQ